MDLDLISPEAPVCWAVLGAFSNNIILRGDDGGRGGRGIPLRVAITLQ